jgi:hypothetical protein
MQHALPMENVSLPYPLGCRLLGDASGFGARQSDDIMLLALVLRQWTALGDHLAHVRDALSEGAGKYGLHRAVVASANGSRLPSTSCGL